MSEEQRCGEDSMNSIGHVEFEVSIGHLGNLMGLELRKEIETAVKIQEP